MVYFRLLSADIVIVGICGTYQAFWFQLGPLCCVCTKQISLTAPHISPCVVAQDIVLERIEPDPGEVPCPQQTVIYLCQVMAPSFSLIWTIPTGDPLEFSIATDVGKIINSTDNVYSANLTSKMDVPGSERDIFSSTLLILETVNGSTITCTGAGTDPVEDSTDIILSSE